MALDPHLTQIRGAVSTARNTDRVGDLDRRLTALERGGGGGLPRVSSLPTITKDGQVISYAADSGNGVVWQLRSNLASGYWEYIGGSDVFRQDDSQPIIATPTPAFTTYNYNVAAIKYTLPFAGDWDVWMNGTVIMQTAASTCDARLFAINVTSVAGLTPGDNVMAIASSSAPTVYGALNHTARFTGAAASVIVGPGFQFSGAGLSVKIFDVTMRLRPVRVH